MSDSPQIQGKKRGGNPPVEYRFKKGQSGNPAGRPKGESVTAVVRRLLEMVEDGKPIKEHVAKAMIEACKKGDARLIKELLDRTEGKVPDRIADANGNALTFIIKPVESKSGDD